LFWNDRREDAAQAADSALVTDPLLAGERHEPELQYEPLLLEADMTRDEAWPEPEPEPEIEPEPEPEPEPETEPEPEADPTTIRGWTVGVHPMALTRAGTVPAAATIRSRVWKNLADVASDVDIDTMQRMMAGKPPTRHNPSTGRSETAKVELDSALPHWPGETTEDFTLV